jgi:quinoprotein dehydrogenase-associated probable ABC transporter substrate-binding protein
MCSRFHRLVFIAAAAFAVAADARELRVCADPDNLPYSRADGSGFENRIAELVARELGAELRYEWMAQIRGYVRKTMGEGLCDVFIGVPTEFERVATTRPYYRSAYVFVTRRGERGPVAFDDKRLLDARVGVQLVGNDLAATPPGYALAKMGAVDNVVGYTVMGEGPTTQRMIDALASRKLDVALAWGPQAAYFARRASVPLEVTIASAPSEAGGMPFEFSISMGVRRGDKALLAELEAVIERRRADIDRILAEYGVPRAERAP